MVGSFFDKTSGISWFRKCGGSFCRRWMKAFLVSKMTAQQPLLKEISLESSNCYHQSYIGELLNLKNLNSILIGRVYRTGFFAFRNSVNFDCSIRLQFCAPLTKKVDWTDQILIKFVDTLWSCDLLLLNFIVSPIFNLYSLFLAFNIWL